MLPDSRYLWQSQISRDDQYTYLNIITVYFQHKVTNSKAFCTTSIVSSITKFKYIFGNKDDKFLFYDISTQTRLLVATDDIANYAAFNPTNFHIITAPIVVQRV